MLQSERGEWQNRNRANQLISFSGLQYDNITPTDIDGMIEYHDMCYVIMEFKHRQKEMPYGQELCFKRLADNLEKAKKPTVLLVCSHKIDNPDDDVIAKDAIVKKYYYRRKWYIDNRRTVQQVVDSFIKFVEMMKRGF